jgi:hypothetical protein
LPGRALPARVSLIQIVKNIPSGDTFAVDLAIPGSTSQ